MLKAERLVWEKERASFQHFNQQDAEAAMLRAERSTQQNTPGAAEVRIVPL